MNKAESEVLGNEPVREPYHDGKTRNMQHVVERFEAAFPGNIGYSVSVYFSPYLKDEIITKSQADAYDEIMLYLDDFKIKVPLLLRALDWYMSSLSSKKDRLQDRENLRKNLNTEWLLNASEEQLELYKKALLKRARAQQVRRNPIEKANITLKNRMEAAGYYSRMQPLLNQLSPTFADHMSRLEALNDKICSELGLRYDDDGYLFIESSRWDD